MTDRDVMKIVIHLLSAATNQFSLAPKDKAICKECAEKLNQHFFGKRQLLIPQMQKRKLLIFLLRQLKRSL